MMVKDEEARIRVTLESLLLVVSILVVLDTGSKDNTLTIIREYCAEHHIELYIKETDFIDFSTSRNEGLDYLQSLNLRVDFIFLIDCNDELRIPSLENLNDYFQKIPDSTQLCYLTLDWWAGTMTVSHKNLRCMRYSCPSRYHGVVHEYLNGGENALTIPSSIVYLYQDRTADNNKSMPRFYRDRDLLLKAHTENPDDARTCYYLAQTYLCLNDFKSAFEYYKKRLSLEGFHEEIYQSLYHMGKIQLSHYPMVPFEEAQKTLLQAYNNCTQAEPLVLLASHYLKEKQYAMAFLYANQAIHLPYPSERALYVDGYIYDYLRYHIMGCIAFYVNEHKIGEFACQKALQTKYTLHPDQKAADQSNLRIYKDILRHTKVVTTEEFLAYKNRIIPFEPHWFRETPYIFLTDRRMILKVEKVVASPKDAWL